eukprot:1073884-Prorocentrum_lima.AAC.1
MTSSLVGSEMCIRDRKRTIADFPAARYSQYVHAELYGQGSLGRHVVSTWRNLFLSLIHI